MRLPGTPSSHISVWHRHIRNSPRIYTMGEMKTQNDKHRFFLWDYLWWVGERLHEKHLRITGEEMLFMYIIFFLFIPIMSLLVIAGVHNTLLQAIWAVFAILVLLGVTWGKRLYGIRRRYAVMKHYAGIKFNPAKGYFLFFLPIMFFMSMLIVIVSLMR